MKTKISILAAFILSMATQSCVQNASKSNAFSGEYGNTELRTKCK